MKNIKKFSMEAPALAEHYDEIPNIMINNRKLTVVAACSNYVRRVNGGGDYIQLFGYLEAPKSVDDSINLDYPRPLKPYDENKLRNFVWDQYLGKGHEVDVLSSEKIAVERFMAGEIEEMELRHVLGVGWFVYSQDNHTL